jgi:hypothetical protein
MSKRACRIVALILSLALLSVISFNPNISAQDSNTPGLELGDNLVLSWLEVEVEKENIVCISIQNSQSGSGDSWCHTYAIGAIQEVITYEAEGVAGGAVWLIKVDRSNQGRVNLALNLTCVAREFGNDVSINCEFDI